MQTIVSHSDGLSPPAPWLTSLGSQRRQSHIPDVQILHRRPPWQTLALLSAWLLFATSGLSTLGVDQDCSIDPGRFSFSLLLLAGSLLHPYGKCLPQSGSDRQSATRLQKCCTRSLAWLRSSRPTCSSLIPISPKPPRPSQVNRSNHSTPLPQLVLSRFILFSLFCFVVSSAFQSPVPNHNIIFDEVGKMAASMTYIHVAIPLNISTFGDQISLFQYYLDHHFLPMTTNDNNAILFTKTI